jgi:hypothetical protein
MSTTLQHLQENFLSYITQADTHIMPEIISSKNASATLRLEVYRNAYSQRLVEILAMNFPVLKQLVGEEKFNELGHAYVKAYPSNHFSIRIFGRHFSKFLNEQSDLETMLLEIANFEWALAEVQEAAEAPAISVDDMAQIPPDAWATLCFTMQPNVCTLVFFTNAPEIWRAIDSNEQAPEAVQQPESIHWMFWSCNNQAFFTPMNQQQYFMVNAIREGQSFGEICENLCEWLAEDEVIQFAAGTLRSWVGDGVFTTYTLK